MSQSWCRFRYLEFIRYIHNCLSQNHKLQTPFFYQETTPNAFFNHEIFHPSFITGPGVVVRKLKNYGGVITSVGKPYKPIFHEVVEYLQSKDIYPGQAVMIGDTMAHDMIGADVSEIDSCFVRSGIHAGAFRNASGPADIDQALNVLIAQYNIRPTYLIEQVRWGKALPDRKHRRRLQPGERVKRRLRRRPIKDKK